MYALPALVRGDNKFVYHEGSLIKLPDALLTDEMIHFYSGIEERGWYQDSFGYYTFAHPVGADELVLFPGIHVADDPPKAPLSFTLPLAKADIETYVRQIFELEKKLFSEASGDINLLVHDLRSISSSIYNSALQARMAVTRLKFDEARTLIDNVICAQTVLKIRTDVLDYLNNPASVIDDADIDLQDKTRRVIEAFRPQATIKATSIKFTARGPMLINGPNIFEFIPYVLLENAVKYSPRGRDINVGIYNEESCYKFFVTSVGPLIETSEREIIFDRGIRGRHAPTGLGSGIGLYVLSTVVRSHFGGRVAVEQDISGEAEGPDDYYITTFTVELPYS